MTLAALSRAIPLAVLLLSSSSRADPTVPIPDGYVVPAEHTARMLFATLPRGAAYAARLIDALSTSTLIGVLESICIGHMQVYIDADETIVGTRIQLEHNTPAPVGTELHIRGWVEGIGDRDATFRVMVDDATSDSVCDATVKLHVVRQDAVEDRIAGKTAAVQCSIDRPAGEPAYVRVRDPA